MTNQGTRSSAQTKIDTAEIDPYADERATYAVVLAIAMAVAAFVVAWVAKAYIPGFAASAAIMYITAVGVPAAVVAMYCVYRKMFGKRASAVMTVLMLTASAGAARWRSGPGLTSRCSAHYTRRS